MGTQRRRDNERQRLNAVEKLGEVRGGLGAAQAVANRIDGDQIEVAAVEPWRAAHQLPMPNHQETRDQQQGERSRDLADYQQVAQAQAAEAADRNMAAAFEPARQAGAGGLDRRRKTERQSGERRQSESEGQNPRVRREVETERCGKRGTVCLKRISSTRPPP